MQFIYTANLHRLLKNMYIQGMQIVHTEHPYRLLKKHVHTRNTYNAQVTHIRKHERLHTNAYIQKCVTYALYVLCHLCIICIMCHLCIIRKHERLHTNIHECIHAEHIHTHIHTTYTYTYTHNIYIHIPTQHTHNIQNIHNIRT